MKFAFCFLTYKSILHVEPWQYYFKTNNVYIHPKEREYVDAKFSSFIIPNIISTSWGNRSIVDATILLLEQAILDSNNQWFILCSEDSCPLQPYADFLTFFEKQTLSVFNVMDATKNKTSQWWALNRIDVELLLHNKTKFDDIFNTIETKYRKEAVDELFFLNALKECNPNYLFKDKCIHYVKWFPEWTSKHPTIFNTLLHEDIQYIKKHSCWFIRKTFPTFQPQLIKKHPICVIMCIGTKSSNRYENFLKCIAGKANIFLLVMDSNKLIYQPLLKSSCEQAYHVVWNMVNKAIKVLQAKFSKSYKKVVVLKENFNYDMDYCQKENIMPTINISLSKQKNTLGKSKNDITIKKGGLFIYKKKIRNMKKHEKTRKIRKISQ